MMNRKPASDSSILFLVCLSFYYLFSHKVHQVAKQPKRILKAENSWQFTRRAEATRCSDQVLSLNRRISLSMAIKNHCVIFCFIMPFLRDPTKCTTEGFTVI